MKAGMTKNSAGIGGKIESQPCMGAFTKMTGGGEIQRLHSRDYSKTAHKAHDKAMSDMATAIEPLFDGSGPAQIISSGDLD